MQKKKKKTQKAKVKLEHAQDYKNTEVKFSR